ncbi:hypothetical protein L3X38_041884 [Prunus dulcis]|uniref:Uncharacterized protein n=1 Tax=Prunus dulcis TaxID=3755 RepID=A0AAD4UTT7_PRUDU|nr:hypothetical protein L3X38_041884 [Prunus dulcis]
MLPPCTPFGNSPIIQTTAEAKFLTQITSLRQDMARLQEHNNLLSSKVDETQQLVIPFYTTVEDLLTHLHSFQSAVRCKVHSTNWRTYDELMKQAAIHAKAEYFNSKFGPSAWQEESALKSYSVQGSPYAPVERTYGYLASQKQNDNPNTRQGHSKKGKEKYDRNDHRAPLSNHDCGQEVFTLLNTTYEVILIARPLQAPVSNMN